MRNIKDAARSHCTVQSGGRAKMGSGQSTHLWKFINADQAICAPRVRQRAVPNTGCSQPQLLALLPRFAALPLCLHVRSWRCEAASSCIPACATLQRFRLTVGSSLWHADITRETLNPNVLKVRALAPRHRTVRACVAPGPLALSFAHAPLLHLAAICLARSARALHPPTLRQTKSHSDTML